MGLSGSKFDQWGWTDADLYRAIDHPEHPGDAAEIAEYVEELKSRAAKRDAQTSREAELRSKYKI